MNTDTPENYLGLAEPDTRAAIDFLDVGVSLRIEIDRRRQTVFFEMLSVHPEIGGQVKVDDVIFKFVPLRDSGEE